MATISKQPGRLTLVNIFTVKPGNQQKLVALLTEATNATMKQLPGFISANIHRGLDGTRVINYAQWRSREDFEAMRQHPDAKPHMAAVAALATFDPILCQVVESIGSNEA